MAKKLSIGSFWAGAWEVTENAKTFLAPSLERY